MSSITIEQAIYGSQGKGGYRFLARSPGFLEAWLPEAQRICTSFGERPAGVACPNCVFAQPFGKRHVAVVQVADQGVDDAGRPGALGFYLLILSRALYRDLGGDPFLAADHFPPPWEARGDVLTLSWPPGPLPHRTVGQVREILQPAQDGPSFLGATQALVEGGKLVFVRPAPDNLLLRKLWTLLPTAARADLWPASFAFGNALQFDAVVVPNADGREFANYVTEDQTPDYPQGRYELNLQIAVETEDQRELDVVFARRSRKETWRIGLILLVMSIVLVLVSNWLFPTPVPGTGKEGRPAPAKLDLPPAENYPALSLKERKELHKVLRDLAVQLGIKPVSNWASSEKLLEDIADKLGTPDPDRNPTKDLTAGPVQRRLRALLWKHGVEAYRDPKLNGVELVERLEQKLAANKHQEK